METFLKVLDPEDSSAGGGSASAIAGAMAAALLAMVARLSGPGSASGSGSESSVGLEEMAERGKFLSARLRDGAREDTESFQAVRDGYRMPKVTDGEKAARLRAIQEAWVLATETPLANAESCLGVLELGAELLGKVNPRVRSDYSSGLYLARAGLLGCLDNVAINIPSLKNAGLVEKLVARAEEFRSRGESLATRLGPASMPAQSAQSAP